MTTRIDNSGPQTNLEVSATSYRVTPPPARPFSALLGSGANAVIVGAEAAAQRIPGGPEIVAAVRDPGAGRGVGSAARAFPTLPDGAQASPSAAAGTVDLSATGGMPTGDASTAGGAGIEGVLARQTQDNLYYLGLQQRIQDETRTFQAVSNVLKTQHESVKNAIGNLR